MKKFYYLICALLFVSLLISSSSMALSRSFKEDQEEQWCTTSSFVPGHDFGRAGWPQYFSAGYEDTALACALDHDHHIVATGYTFDSSTGDFLTIKYDSQGNEIWNATYDGGEDDLAFGIAINSENKVFVYGFSGNWSSLEGELVLVVYSEVGTQEWTKSFTFDVCNYPGGITIDSQDNIIVTGGSGDWQQNMYCWIIKMTHDGSDCWNSTFHEGLIDIGLAVTVDFNDHILLSGINYSPFAGSIFLIKYNEAGQELWKRRLYGEDVWGLAVDSENNIIMVGRNYSYYTQDLSTLTAKWSSSGDFLWQQEYTSGGFEGLEGVAVDSQDNIVAVGYSSFGVQQQYEHLAFYYSADGEELCLKRPMNEGFLYDVVIDTDDTLYVVGGYVFESQYMYFYTDVFEDMEPPEGEILKPQDTTLYILNRELFQLPKNTIAFGKLTVQIDAVDPADISKVEFYVDNILMATITTEPWEWLWETRSFGRHTLKVMIYDETGCSVRDEQTLFKFF